MTYTKQEARSNRRLLFCVVPAARFAGPLRDALEFRDLQ